MKAVGHGGPEAEAGLGLPAPVIVLEALSRFIPPRTIRLVLINTGRQTRRIRRLPATAVVWLVIAIGSWTDLDVPAIWRQVVGTLRSLFLALGAKRPPANAAAFGRPGTRRNGQSIDGAYPQWHAVFLAETGTHRVVEAYIKRGKRSEFKVATSLLRKAPSGCLVLQDRGFYGYRPLAEANRRGIHLLGRVGKHVVFKRTETTN